MSSSTLPSYLVNQGRYVLLIALLTRIAVPAGFMPGDVSQGWFLELCPTGLAPGAMTALLGGNHDHEGHHQGNADQTDYGADCVLSGLALAALPADGLNPPDIAAAREALHSARTPALRFAATAGYHSRAPPTN